MPLAGENRRVRPRQDIADPARPGRQRKASGGNRTRNPRITNAVLCRLKLRWRTINEKTNELPEQRPAIGSAPVNRSAAAQSRKRPRPSAFRADWGLVPLPPDSALPTATGDDFGQRRQ